MSVVLSFRFQAGRYHATPWGRNLNEGEVEWPPSPWRILRALYATWQNRCPDLEGEVVELLLGRLAAPPAISVPRHRVAHTRHYFPDTAHRNGVFGNTDKALDSFAAVDPAQWLHVRWECTPSPIEVVALGSLVSALSYLGRAEAICEAKVLPEPPPGLVWLSPVEGGSHTVSVLAPTEPLDVAALGVTTTDVRRAGRLTPAGAAWIRYEPPRAETPQPQRSRRRQPRVTAVRFALTAAVLPSRISAVAIAHNLHAATAKKVDRLESPGIELLTGVDAAGGPLRGQHEHAHHLIFAGEENRHGRWLDSAVIWVPGGMEAAAVRRLAQIDRLWSGRAAPDARPVTVAFEGQGGINDLAPELTGLSRVWESFTPFGSDRHQHRNQTWDAFLAAEVRREAALRSLPAVAAVEPLSPDRSSPPFSGGWLEFRRHRPSEKRIRARRAIGLRITFEEPVPGPICLGALSHFGLGMFLPFKGTRPLVP